MNSRHQLILIRIICAATLFLAGVVLGTMPLAAFLSLYFYIAAAVLVGYDVVISAVNGIIHGHMLDENSLMVAGSVCAFVLGEYAEGTFILLFYQVGELFQAIAVGRSRRSIAELMNIRPDSANLISDNGEISVVDPYDVTVGDVILVDPGEKVPLDGIILEGFSSVDTASLTGESVPLELKVGDAIISGSVNLTSPLRIRVTKEFDESTVSKILELAENASTKKAKTEKFVTAFAKYYTPAVVIAALLIAVLPPLFFGGWGDWILKAVMFIVISCPCALVVSVPLAFFGALGGASRVGILVKGSNYLETLAAVDTVVFDKTGTLTKGAFKVIRLCPSDGVTEEQLLSSAALCEKHSSHPIACSVKEAYGRDIADEGIYEEVAGKGVKCTLQERTLAAGNRELMKELGLEPPEVSANATVIHVADDVYLGHILISDEIKPGSKEAVAELKRLGVKKTVMLTGDREETAEEVAEALSVDEFHAGLLPADKVKLTEDILSSSRGRVAFVGDGVNDAPVLARADVGVAMGGLGSDAAIEASDIVIMNDDLRLISKAMRIARRALRISKQNIAVSLIVKFGVLLLSLIGLSNIWLAVFADVGVLIIAVLNSMRTLKKIR